MTRLTGDKSPFVLWWSAVIVSWWPVVSSTLYPLSGNSDFHSAHFLSTISSGKIQDHETTFETTFDKESLFTNVPIKIISCKSHTMNVGEWPRSCWQCDADSCLNSRPLGFKIYITFSTNGSIYWQWDSTAMRHLVAAVISHPRMGTAPCNPKIWKCYLDDTSPSWNKGVLKPSYNTRNAKEADLTTSRRLIQTVKMSHHETNNNTHNYHML